MYSVSMAFRHAALALLLGFAAAAHASFVSYTSQSSFLAAVASPVVDSFDDLPLISLPASLGRSAGAYGYTVSAPSGLFGVGSAADPWLSTDNALEPLTFNGFSSNLRAIGGFFFGTDFAGNELAGQQLFLTLTDVALNSYVTALTATNSTAFFGVKSTNALLSLTLVTDAAALAWPTANNLVLAASGAVAGTALPEPASGTLALLGLVILLACRRRGPARS